MAEYVSRFDDNKTYQRDQGVVTLLRVEGGNHAEIAVEGIVNGARFAQFAHLQGPSSRQRPQDECYSSHSREARIVAFQDLPENFSWAASRSWVRPWRCVQEMIDRINEEAEHPPQFNILGRHGLTKLSALCYAQALVSLVLLHQPMIVDPATIFGRERVERAKREAYNCVSWAVERIELAGIRIFCPVAWYLRPWSRDVIDKPTPVALQNDGGEWIVNLREGVERGVNPMRLMEAMSIERPG